METITRASCSSEWVSCSTSSQTAGILSLSLPALRPASSHHDHHASDSDKVHSKHIASSVVTAVTCKGSCLVLFVLHATSLLRDSSQGWASPLYMHACRHCEFYTLSALSSGTSRGFFHGWRRTKLILECPRIRFQINAEMWCTLLAAR